MRILHKAALLLTLFIVLALQGKSQSGAWSFFQPVTAVNETGSDQTDYQVRLEINTQSLISQSKLESDGRDIRFGDDCSTTGYDYWIEDFINTDSTVVWVRLDSIAAGDSLNFQMFYGNSNAVAASSFAATFPNAIITNGNQTLLPGAIHRWIQVNTGDTLFLANDSLNDLEARVVNVQGVISGKGRGYQVPGNSNIGTGPGGGNFGTASGAAGGSYGGLGGIGGYDANDPIIQPSMVYGTVTGPDIAKGSSGGSASQAIGGSGGGGLRLLAEFMTVAGTIECDGNEGQQPGAGQGGGGGSGGGILLHGDEVNLSGSLSSTGGGGSIGTSTANDDGGGGGGGRLKVFYENQLNNTGTMSVLGGPGGINGGAGTGAPGAAGSMHTATLAFEVVIATFGAEQANLGVPSPPTISGIAGVYCGGDSVEAIVSGSFSMYNFILGGQLAQSSVDSTFDFIADSTTTLIIQSMGVCDYNDTIIVTVSSAPDPMVTGPPGTLCMGDSALLSVANGFTNVVWSTGAVAQNIQVFTSATYTVEVTDINGCMAMDTLNVNFLQAPMPVITFSTQPPLCDGDSITLGTANPWPSYLWANGDTSATITLTQSASTGVEVTDANGCTNGVFANILFNPLPNPSISVAGNALTVNPVFSSYQWLLNGNTLAGGTTQTWNANNTGTYSVTVTDVNGCTATSDTTFLFVALQPKAAQTELVVAPNPFQDQVKFETEISVSGNLEVTVINATGRICKREILEVVPGRLRHTMDLATLPAGIYFLRLESEESQGVARMIKR